MKSRDKEIPEMEVYALHKSNIDSFEHLVDPSAVEVIKWDEAHGFCVKTDGVHVGALVGRFTDEKDYEILSLFVLPEYRKRGVGELLLETLWEVLDNLEANVKISFLCLSDDESELADFLEKNGFEEYRNMNSHVFAVTIEELKKTKLFADKVSVHFPNFNDLTKAQLTALDNLTGAGFVPKPDGGFTSKQIEKEMSAAFFKRGKPVAYAVIERENDDLLILSSLYVSEKEPPATLMKLLRSVLEALDEKYTEDTVLLLPTVNEDSERLFSDLFEDAFEKEDVFCTYQRFYPGRREPDYEAGTLSDFLYTEEELLTGM